MTSRTRPRNSRRTFLLLPLGLLIAPVSLWAIGLSQPAASADVPPDFNLQVSPSPLVATLKPGVKTTLQLQVHNEGTGTEELQITPRSFTFDSSTGKVDLNDTTPPPIAAWISFSAQKFTVPSNQTFTEQVTLNPPKDAGFSYSFALVINRQNNPKPAGGTREINGSLAVFSLMNIDRPGATSDLKVSSFTVSKKVYEYLPATFSVRFNNAGNTIVQPSGNLFVQRGSGDKTPLATLTVNKTQGYILPGTQRTITASWNDGFPSYQTVTNPDGSTKQKLVWNWGQLSRLRIGRYTASLVAVYSQGGHDVPITGSVTFWLFPWKILLVVTLVVLLVLYALYTLVRNIVRRIKRTGAKHKAKKAGAKPPETPKPAA
ncbi:MAG: hypothetical protein WDN27_04315 [Candidatus Saccharibacteria bacterium]